MKVTDSKSGDPNIVWETLFRFVNLILDSIEQERGKIGLIQYFAEVKLCNALNGIVYGPDCKPRNLRSKA